MGSIRDEIIQNAEANMARKREEAERATREHEKTARRDPPALPLPPFNMPRAVFYLMSANVVTWSILYGVYLVDAGRSDELAKALIGLFIIPLLFIWHFIRWIIAYLDYAFFWPIRVILWLLISIITVGAVMTVAYEMLTGSGFPVG